MKETVSKVEVVSSTNEKLERRKKLAEFLEKKFERESKQVSEKLYDVPGGLTTAKHLYEFVFKDASWKFSESIGVIEAARILSSEIEIIKDKKERENLLLNAVTIEAIYYFLTKVEKKGVSSARDFLHNLYRPIYEALTSSKEDRDRINQMMRDLGTLQDAILNRVNFEGEDKLLNEIEKELNKELESDSSQEAETK